jgi:hypothetical protein
VGRLYGTYFERGHRDKGGKGVKLLLGAFIVITPACITYAIESASLHLIDEPSRQQLTFKLHSQPMRYRLDPSCPNLLIQLWVQPNVACAHRFLRKLNDRFDGPRGPFFEGSAMYEFV